MLPIIAQAPWTPRMVRRFLMVVAPTDAGTPGAPVSSGNNSPRVVSKPSSPSLIANPAAQETKLFDRLNRWCGTPGE